MRAELEKAIQNGEFGPGSQLPGEHALAERFGVSYLTARRAVCELVEADLLERRARKGTFVVAHSQRRLSTTTLNLIISSYGGAFHRSFVEKGMELGHRKGWEVNVVLLAPAQQESAVRAIGGNGFSVLLLDPFSDESPIARALRKGGGRAVSLGLNCTHLGVPSIYTDPQESLKLAVEHLRQYGHHEVLLVMQSVDTALNASQRSALREVLGNHLSEAELDERILMVPTPMFKCASQDAYRIMSQWLAHKWPHATALVCSGDEITQGVLAASRNIGHPVPSALSVVNILDVPSMAFSHPAVTCVDVQLELQLEMAGSILERAEEAPGTGVGDLAVLQHVSPRIIRRESVAPPSC